MVRSRNSTADQATPSILPSALVLRLRSLGLCSIGPALIQRRFSRCSERGGKRCLDLKRNGADCCEVYENRLDGQGSDRCREALSIGEDDPGGHDVQGDCRQQNPETRTLEDYFPGRPVFDTWLPHRRP